MDKFEQMAQMMAQMSSEQVAEAMKKRRSMCTCGSCPTYNDCTRSKNQLLFCAVGKSEGCTLEMKGCVCPTCPVAADMGLTHSYFCARGSEKQQRGM